MHHINHSINETPNKGKGTMQMAQKDAPLTLDEENAEREKYNGLLKDDILNAASAIRSQKQKSAEVSGDLSGKLDVFEKKGGLKSAIKTAERVTGMEPAECQDWFRAFLAYFDALGGNDQLDMFDQERANESNITSIAQASKVAEPQDGAEPTLN